MRLKHATGMALLTIAALVVVGCGSSTKAEPSTTSSTRTTTVPPTTTSSSTTTSTTSTTSTSSTTTTSTTVSSAPAPTDPITGRALSKNPVAAAKIDNTSFPQYGVADADVIYTEQVEGGLTRLIAIYHTTFPKEIGAVRSIRSTDMHLLPSYGPILLVTSGGAAPNVRLLRKSILVGVAEGASGLWRSSTRRAPYNLHADVQKIVKNHPKQPAAKSPGFTFGPLTAAQLAATREVTKIDVQMIAGETSFSYDKGTYAAYHNGTRYTDADGRTVSVNNVLLQHVRDEPDGILDPIGNPSYLTRTTGSGKFTLYRNGKAINGTWSRQKDTDPMKYVDTDGNPVNFTPGKTWVLLAPQTSKVKKG